MKTDLYTKTVLTVIAACLLWMCFTSITPVAQAQAGPTPVVLVNEKGVPIYTADGIRVSFASDPLPVVVNNAVVPVAVRVIQRSAQWDALAVQVLRDAPTLMPVP